MTQKPYIISVTGTKGKTTITRLLNYVYRKTNRPTLLVDTDGHYLNGKRRSTVADSKKLYGLIPTTCPGKFLYELKNKKNSIAILESTIDSSVYGNGYNRHQIGIFTNVFKDHMGFRIKTRHQLAKEKSRYIFKHIGRKGTAIFNADDRYVTNQLSQIPDNNDITLLPVGLQFKYFDIESHLRNNGLAVTIQNDSIGILSQDNFSPIINPENISWTFGGTFLPSLYNLMFAIGAIYTEQRNHIPKKMLHSITNYRLNPNGGRLSLFENKKKDIKVIVDFAHEKYSLKAVGELAKQLANNKTIGVIRLASDRPNKVIQETGRYVANSFDTIIVYDRVDGKQKSQFIARNKGIIREIGEVSQILAQTIRSKQTKGHRVIRVIPEDEALDQAFTIAQEGDVIVHIINDDVKRSYKLIKKHLGHFYTKRIT